MSLYCLKNVTKVKIFNEKHTFVSLKKKTYRICKSFSLLIMDLSRKFYLYFINNYQQASANPLAQSPRQGKLDSDK